MERRIFLMLLVLLILPAVATAQVSTSNFVDLIWQGETYTPPFYKGRALWSNESKIMVVAIPHINGVTNTSNLIYRWTKNDVVLGNVSGVGKNSLSFQDTILSKPQTVKIDVFSGENEFLATANTVLTPATVSILVYENNPIYGFLFHREAGGGYSLRESEITFSAFPLFFSEKRLGSNVEFEWRTNTGSTGDGVSATYRAPEGISGTSQIFLHILDKERMRQDARKNFRVEFSNNNEL
jgi:hypothetical protein